jgi:AAA15 family ATPase/GTPase
MLLLALHKGKLVLIDEVDAGIYHNRFKQFWKIILEIAKKDNTQIIATTHNDECIKYFTEELKDLGESFQKDSRVVQLKKVNDVTKIRSYEYDSFNLALIDGLEIRGGE